MIDKKSHTILKILQEKARIPNTEISRQVGIAPSAVLERIRKMENQGIIEGYEVRLNSAQFAKNQVAFLYLVVDPSQDRQAEVGKTLSEFEEIQEVHFVASQTTYIVKLRISDTRELSTFLRTNISAIPGIISMQAEVVLETYKETAKIPIS